MVRNTYKTISISRGLITLFALASLIMPAFFINGKVSAAVACATVNGEKQCSDNGTFNVEITDLLTVDITKPSTWASGDANTLLTNKVTVSVSSNNAAGYTASMTTGTNSTNLINQANNSVFIPTVAADDTSSTAEAMLGHWGYNIVNNNAAAPTSFNQMVAKNAVTPITVLTSNSPATTTKDVYFGAKANYTQAAGTYSSNVVISVVSGVYNDPTTPSNPSTPTDDNNNSGGTVAYNENGAAGTATGNTVYTNNYGSSATSSTYSEISSGNHTGAYSGYTAPQGEVNTVAAIDEGTPLATGLAVTAAVAAVAGVAFFAVAKHQDGSDDDFE